MGLYITVPVPYPMGCGINHRRYYCIPCGINYIVGWTIPYPMGCGINYSIEDGPYPISHSGSGRGITIPCGVWDYHPMESLEEEEKGVLF